MCTLVVMAAGLGSRFGGNKQVSVVDNDGNFIIDYSVYDALKAGFNKVIFIIREEDKKVFEASIGKRLKNYIDVEYAFQTLEDIPVKEKYDRTKPWGTTHAIYSVRNILPDKFLIINADDFYGSSSFKKAYDFLSNIHESYHYACISYLAKNTVNGSETVKRGVLSLDKNIIKSIIESKISVSNSTLVEPLDGSKTFSISADAPVSMNMFACTSDLFNIIETDIKEFFTKSKEQIENDEILLPMTLNNFMQKGLIKIDNISSTEEWLGMTYKEDLDLVKEKIEAKRKNGDYPLHLWK